ncbi:MAG: S-layer homology domain-containing protein [Meiothermus sp.]|uniref:S-layer homology domain-containing protein n=1 Tax=Meiothermus sp. TaxID=1955249 RepID=UPI0025DA8673|nr:S-layer homology domain-containing protein [Meiothermus sp.]MCS7069054.1 S-layer homology domain-containing protein [Meiothermus sp.]
MRMLFFVTVFVTTAFALPNDVAADHWAAQAVGQVTARGWLQGFPGGQFKGEVRLDRFQLATTLARVLADSPMPVQEAEVRFKDVKPNHWALPGIRRMVGEGLVQGFPDQTYRGTSLLTRYQLAVVLDKLAQRLGLAAPAKLVRPDDLPLAHWAEAAVQRMVALQIMPLGSDGQFRGNEAVSRYQMAHSLWKLEAHLSSMGAGTQSGVAGVSKPQPASAATTPGAAQPAPASAAKASSSQPSGEPVVQSSAKPALEQNTLTLGQLARLPLPEAWAGLSLEQTLVHLGQAMHNGRVWVTLRREGESALALLRLSEPPSIEAFYPVGEAVAAASEGWAWLEGGQRLLFLDPKTQKSRVYGPIGQPGAREALPPLFARGVHKGLLGGVALDESRNYLAMMGGRPLCVPNCEAASSSPVLRLVLLGLNPDGLFAEYAYLLDNPKNEVVGLAWPKPRLLLVHETDGQKSRVYSVDLNEADDLAFTEWDTLEAGLEVRPAVKPLAKRLILEVALEKPRGLAILNPSEAVVAEKGLIKLAFDKPLW